MSSEWKEADNTSTPVQGGSGGIKRKRSNLLSDEQFIDEASLEVKTTIVSNRAVFLRKRIGKNPLHECVKVGAHGSDLMNAMLKTGKTFSTNAPYKPMGEKVKSRGKVFTFKIKRHRRLIRFDRNSFKKMHGHFLCKSRKAKKTKSVFGDSEYMDQETQSSADESSIAVCLPILKNMLLMNHKEIFWTKYVGRFRTQMFWTNQNNLLSSLVSKSWVLF